MGIAPKSYENMWMPLYQQTAKVSRINVFLSAVQKKINQSAHLLAELQWILVIKLTPLQRASTITAAQQHLSIIIYQNETKTKLKKITGKFIRFENVASALCWWRAAELQTDIKISKWYTRARKLNRNNSFLQFVTVV